MINDVIERYDTFNTKGFPYELNFGDFNDQPIPSDYYNFLNDSNDDGNIITGTPFYYALTDSKGLEDAVIPNDEKIYDGIIIDDNDSLASSIGTLQNNIMEIKGAVN